MAATYPLGQQPVYDMFYDAGYWVPGFSETYGLNRRHVYWAFRGMIRPSHELRLAAVDLFGVPVSELFTPAALETPYRLQHNSHVDDRGAP